MKTKELPLMMGEKLIGIVVLDYETGELQGRIEPGFVTLLEELLQNNLTEVAFFGKPGIPAPPLEVQKKLQDYLDSVKTNLEEIKVGQIWIEKHKRPDYLAKRTLEVKSIEQKTISDQDGFTDITPITYAVSTKGFYIRQPAKRTMSTYILRKKWELMEG